jgi:glycosyltransferase involved in cell wall biosynthesis
VGQLSDPHAMKLALLVPGRASKWPSGGDLYDLQLARALEERGRRVDVLRTPRGMNAGAWARRLLRGGYAALLQDELGHAEYLQLNQALAGRVPRIALVHVTQARLEPDAGSAPLERAFLRSVSAALFVSRQVRRETQRLLGVRLPARVAHPGSDHVPVRTRRVAGARGLRLLSVGHLLPHKGQLELLHAFAAVSGRAKLRLAGDAARDRAYAARVRRAASQLGAARVQLLGPLSPAALARALAGADVFVSTSAYESYGIAIAEALASGLPVVTWARGGVWEFLEPGHNALRVAPGDLAGLTHALERLCREPRLLARLTRGAQKARLPSWADAAAQLEALLPRRARALA